mmetsp:Transcript_4217/g.19119  ORF Transcript_4217/g.19119 Transcript_4217/m.19119 type:complete len:226 (-) Transcript_4217:906-1583(-)
MSRTRSSVPSRRNPSSSRPISARFAPSTTPWRLSRPREPRVGRAATATPTRRATAKATRRVTRTSRTRTRVRPRRSAARRRPGRRVPTPTSQSPSPGIKSPRRAAPAATPARSTRTTTVTVTATAARRKSSRVAARTWARTPSSRSRCSRMPLWRMARTMTRLTFRTSSPRMRLSPRAPPPPRPSRSTASEPRLARGTPPRRRSSGAGSSYSPARSPANWLSSSG